jgi:hypothetical protein
VETISKDMGDSSSLYASTKFCEIFPMQKAKEKSSVRVEIRNFCCFIYWINDAGFIWDEEA